MTTLDAALNSSSTGTGTGTGDAQPDAAPNTSSAETEDNIAHAAKDGQISLPKPSFKDPNGLATVQAPLPRQHTGHIFKHATNSSNPRTSRNWFSFMGQGFNP
jgi:hypothetical protein